MIVVDLPPEMDEELCIPALNAGINFIRLATPTTDDKRLPKVLKNTSGFVYYVSMTGITGSAIADFSKVSVAVDRIQAHTNLPVCVVLASKPQNMLAPSDAMLMALWLAQPSSMRFRAALMIKAAQQLRPWKRSKHWLANFRVVCVLRVLPCRTNKPTL